MRENLTTEVGSILSVRTTASLTVWINRGLESIWLLVVFLTPLAYLDQTYAISEASIGYVEVPKIALLRTLVGLMVVLWLIKWSIHGRLPFTGLPSGLASLGVALHRLWGWLRERPTRWLFLAAWFFLGTTLLSTALSGSRHVSLWGEVPGQDGYPAYTVGRLRSTLRRNRNPFKDQGTVVATNGGGSSHRHVDCYLRNISALRPRLFGPDRTDRRRTIRG